ncbi:MAG: hypothetical protein ACHQQR_11285 [Gemmatimonadales bacterium]
MRGLGSAGLSVFDATEYSAGIETAGPRMSASQSAVRLGFRSRQLPFGIGAQAVRETEFNGGVGIPLSAGHASLDLGIARAKRSALAGLSETGWIFSVGIAIKPY